MSANSGDKEQMGLLLKIVNRLDKLENLNNDMADIKSSSISLSKDLNRLCSDYEKLDQKVDSLNDQVLKIMDPETGIYPKIFKLETNITSFTQKIDEEKSNKKEKDSEQKELNEITKQLKIVGGGKELEKAKKAIDFHESFSRLFWIIIGGFTIQFIGTIMTLLKK